MADNLVTEKTIEVERDENGRVKKWHVKTDPELDELNALENRRFKWRFDRHGNLKVRFANEPHIEQTMTFNEFQKIYNQVRNEV